jgi:hypothetical protein
MDGQARCRSSEAAMMEPDAFDFAFRLAELIEEAHDSLTPDEEILNGSEGPAA